MWIVLKQGDFEAVSRTVGIAADLLAQEFQILTEKVSAIAQGSIDQYTPLVERLGESIEEPDKNAGFTFVGNDTWLPKRLVNARKNQQRKDSRVGKGGIVWTG